MKTPVQITFHNLPPSEEVESKIRAEAEQLDGFSERISSCRVGVDVPHRHHRAGNDYQLRIDPKIPGREILVSPEPDEPGERRDIDVVIRDAFDEARRQLDEHARILRSQLKARDAAAHGRVIRLSPADGYGFLETPDGREIYFHSNSVLDGGFGQLHVGREVTSSEEQGDKGPQASTVRPVGRHGHH